MNGVGSRPKLMQYPTGRASPPVPVTLSPDNAGGERKAGSKLALLSAKLSRKNLIVKNSDSGGAQESEVKESLYNGVSGITIDPVRTEMGFRSPLTGMVEEPIFDLCSVYWS